MKISNDDFANYGIVKGPVHNNYNVCDNSDYLVTFQYIDTDGDEYLYDLYVVTNWDTQTILYRRDSNWEGSYGAVDLKIIINSHNDFYRQITNILQSRGRIKWIRN